MRKVSLVLASILFSAFAFSSPTSATSAIQAAGSITSITASCTGQGNADGVLTVSGAMTGQTVTLVLTAHKPSESTFTSTGVTKTIALIDGQSTYSFSLAIPTMYQDSSVYNTLRIEVAASTLTDGNTTKSVSFSCGAVVVTPTPTPSPSVIPSPSVSPSPSVIPSPSVSPSPSATATPTTVITGTPTGSPSVTVRPSASTSVLGSQTAPNQQATVSIGAGTTPMTQSQIAPSNASAGRTTTTNVAGVQGLPSTSTSSAPVIPAGALGLGLIVLGGVILRRAVVNS